MALTIGEANAVNVLLDHIALARPDGTRPRRDFADVRTSAQLLARGANKTLAAGWSEQMVTDRWPVTP